MRSREFVLLLIATFFLVLSVVAAGIAVPIYLRQEGYTNAVIGLVLMSPVAIAAVLRPLAGRQSDRRGRKLFLLLGSAAAGTACIIYAGATTPIPLFLGSLLMACGFAAFDTSCYALAADVSREANRVEAMSLVGVSWGLASTLAPVIVLFGRRLLGFHLLFLLGGCSGFLALLTASFLPKLDSNASRTRSSRPWKATRNQKATLLPVVLYAAFSGVTGAFLVISANRAGIRGAELFFTVSGAIIVFSRIFARRLGDRFARRSVIAASGAGVAASLVIIGFARNLHALILGAVACGASAVFLWPATVALLLDHSPATDRGAALGRNSAVFDVAFGTAPVAFAYIADLLGYPVMYLVASFAIVILLVCFLRLTREADASAQTGRAQTAVYRLPKLANANWKPGQ